MSVRLKEDVKGGISQTVGIMVTKLILKVVVSLKETIFFIPAIIVFQTQILPSVTVKLVAGTTVAVWPFIIYMKVQQGANFGQI